MRRYASHTDETLVSLLQEGDSEAFTEIYNRYQGLLYVFVCKRLKNREEAKDIIHELFLKLWTDHRQLRIMGKLSVYLYSAVRNRIINTIARQEVAERYIDSFLAYIEQVDHRSADFLVRENQLQSFIQQEIDQLQPRLREVFELSRNTTLSRKQIAERLGISEETVKSHMHQALKSLKSRLGHLTVFLF